MAAIPGTATGPLKASRIAIYGRDGGRQVRFISDDETVDVGDLIDVAFFDTQEEADATAHAIAGILQAQRSLSSDGDGWHKLPADVPVERFLANLLRAARNDAWAFRTPKVGLQPDDTDLPRTAPPMALASLLPASVVLPAMPIEPLRERASSKVARPKRTRACRVWTRDRELALVELVFTSNSAKEVAADPRMAGVTVEAIYQHASLIGLSFRTSPQITVRDLPSSALSVFDRAAAACNKTRDGFVRLWMMRAAADPTRFGLTAVHGG